MTKQRQAALLASATQAVVTKKVSGLQRRSDQMDAAETKNRHQPVSNGLKIKLDRLQTFEPLTENQRLFFEAYKNGEYFMGLFGSAGVGKTFIAMYKALEEVLDKSNSFKQVVVVRSAKQIRDQGFVPGTLDEKQEIYELPYKEIAATLLNRPDAWERLKEQEMCRFITTTAIRGISVDDAIIIVDEAQNLNFHELDTVMTRVGYRSKIMFVGDIRQTDLITNKYDQTGLPDFIRIARSTGEFKEIEFTTDDIVRSSLVKSYLISKESLGF
jgi:phosphate starvation-inducible PhoH-like protein/PhoH-like ATPase